ncbi:glycosyltransferase [Peptostreptococcus porci]|uniref:glycosyltransferase n=1 Tax=Peptostreptococcus porci TaxID=2652282 RepID=UPI002A910E3E|nr:glycosyltransferase [Peptostreptococcus porci]
MTSKRNMFLSVIVPAYNVENYIMKCLDSLLVKSEKDYEIIVVNDGSTDKTGTIIENNYINKVVYINKENNTGLSDTRNIGLQKATGEFVIFVDGDDYVECDYIESISETINNNSEIDVVYTGHYKEKKGKRVKNIGFESEINKIWAIEDFLISELGKRHFPVPACFSIYRRKFLLENNLKFVTGIYHEDELWSVEVALKAKYVMTSDLCYYNYVIRTGSITQKNDLTQNGLDVIFICNKMINMLNNIENLYVKKLFANHISMLYMKGMCRGKLYRKQYRKQFKRFLPIKYAYFCKDKIKALLFAFSPYLYSRLDLKYGKQL